MKTVKNIFLIIISLLLIFSACGSDSSGEGSSASTDTDITTVNEATPQGVSLTCDVPDFTFYTVQTSKGDFSRIKPASQSVKLYGGGIGGYSKPEVPVTVFFLAFPNNATSQDANITVKPAGGRIINNLALYPVQKPKYDLIGATEEQFDYDEQIYSASVTKASEIKLSKVNGIEDANIWKLTVNLMDYDPASKQGTLYDKIDIDVSFTGNTDYYSVKRVPRDANNGLIPVDDIDQWLEEGKSSSKKINVKNEAILQDENYRDPRNATATFAGARFIIVTEGAFVSAGNRLAAHKESLGISTYVIVTDAIPATGDLDDFELRDYLVNCYNNWAVQPRWVLLIGDAEFIPTHSDAGSINGHDLVPNSGDMYYGQIHGDAMEMPVFGIGRFPMDTLTEANVIVDKIIAYETNPPAIPMIGDSYYSRMTFAAEFQDVDDDHPVADGRAVRRFAETSEHIRNYLNDFHFNIERIYKASSAHDPLYWADGTEIPWYLKRPVFDWNGSTFDIINAVNNGTSILYHRDHGAYYGWGTPSFESSNLSSITITDNQYPAVYSINCASGYFDNETQGLYWTSASTVTWSERFIRNQHGAIGVICDTRCSDTGMNNYFAKGLFDATWPEYLSYGSGTPICKLGDILNHAKGYVASCGFEDVDTRQENVIYNLLGDPTVEVKSQPPIVISAAVSSWLSRSLLTMNIPIPDPSDLAMIKNPLIAVAVEPVTGTVVGRAILKRESMSASNTISIPINEQKLGNYNNVNVYLSGSDVKRISVSAEFN
ncbi:MAG: C25 family cysteine peptidase [Spirochaetota bacterium]